MSDDRRRAGMDTIGMLLRADVRRRRRSLVALVVLVGLVGGVSMASFAAYQRTTTAMGRFVEQYRPSQAYVEGIVEREDVEAIPGVEAVSGGDYFLLVPVVDGEPVPGALGGISPFSTDNGDEFRTFGRSMLVEGRLRDPAEELEVMVDEELADAYDVHAGDTFPMQGYAMDQADDLFTNIGRLEPAGPIFDFEIAGVVRAPQDVVGKQRVPDVVYLGSSEVFLGPAFNTAHRGEDVLTLDAIFLEPGTVGYEMLVDFDSTSPADLVAALSDLDPDAEIDLTGSDALIAAEEGERSIDLQASLLLAFAVLVALGGLVLVSQAIRRQADEGAGDRSTLRAIGLAPRALTTVALVQAAIIGVAAAMVACVIAVALSPLGPVGYARRAEIDPGIEVRPAVLAAGVVLIVAVVVLRSAASVRRGSRGLSGAARRVAGGLGDRAGRAGFPAPVVAGVRAATLRTGGRTVVVTVVIAAAGIVGGASFAASEERLATDPDLWGWNWDFAVGDSNDPTVVDRGREQFPEDPRVDAFAMVFDLASVQIDNGSRSVVTGGSAYEMLEGDIEPRMLSGDAPSGDDEIALGGATASKLEVGVGDSVEVGVGGDPTSFTVSGIVVLNLGFDADRIGEGSLLPPAGVERAGGELQPTVFLVDYAPEVDLTQAYEDLRADWGNTVLRPIAPVDVFHLDSVRHLPTAFSLLVGAIAAVTLAFVLALTVRRGRRDMALLRTLGFDARQLRTTVAVQATTLVLPAALAGAFIGLVAGRVAWAAVAEGLGAPSVPVLSITAAVIVVVGALVAGNLIAAVPGRSAARTRPAVVMRTE